MERNETLQVRLDKWLWAARLFKTRGLAGAAIRTGKVRANGERVKPARPVRVGDELHLRRGGMQMTIVVTQLSSRRGPAAQAAGLYQETPESRAAREEQLAQRRALAADAGPRRRPDKRARQHIIRFTRKHATD